LQADGAGHPGPRGVASLSWPTGQGAGKSAGSSPKAWLDVYGAQAPCEQEI